MSSVLTKNYDVNKPETPINTEFETAELSSKVELEETEREETEAKVVAVSKTKERPLKVSFRDNYFQEPQAQTLTFSELFKKLDFFNPDPRLDSIETKKEGKDPLPLFHHSHFLNNIQKESKGGGVLGSNLFVFDFDGGVSWDQVEQSLRVSGLRCFMLTSPSNGLEGKEKFRVVLEADSEIDKWAYKMKTRALAERLGWLEFVGTDSLDEKSFDKSVGWFFGACGTLVQPRSMFLEGEPVQVDTLKASAAALDAGKTSGKSRTSGKTGGTVQLGSNSSGSSEFVAEFQRLSKIGKVNPAKVQEWFEDRLKMIREAGTGSRNQTLLDEASKVRSALQLKILSDSNACSSSMIQASTLDAQEAFQTVQSAFSYSEPVPFSGLRGMFDFEYWNKGLADEKFKEIEKRVKSVASVSDLKIVLPELVRFLKIVIRNRVMELPPGTIPQVFINKKLRQVVGEHNLTKDILKLIEKDSFTICETNQILNPLRSENQDLLYSGDSGKFVDWSRFPDPLAVGNFKYTARGEHNLNYNLSQIFKHDRRFTRTGLNDLKLEPELCGEVFTDGTLDRLFCWVVETYELTAATKTVFEKVMAKCTDNILYKAEEFYDSTLPDWDGKSRFSILVKDILRVDEDLQEVSERFMRKWFISLMARAYSRHTPEKTIDGHFPIPGKVDTVLVFVSPQGDSKSSFFRELVGKDLFNDSLTGFDRDNIQIAHTTLISEIPEIDSLTISKTASELKREITKIEDKVVLKYDRLSKTLERKFVFVGTTNQMRFLMDRTGNRRFWPVMVGSIDLNLLREEKLQLLAEARKLFRGGERWWFTKQEQGEIEEYLEEFLPKFEWEPMFLEKIEANRTKFFKIEEIEDFARVMDSFGNKVKLNYLERDRIQTLLRKRGWRLDRLPRSVNSSRMRRWFVPDEVGQDLEQSLEENPKLEEFLEPIH